MTLPGSYFECCTPFDFVTPLQFFRLRYSLDVLLFVTLMEVILIVILSAGPFHFDTHC